MNIVLVVLKNPLFWTRVGAIATLASALLVSQTWEQATAALALFSAAWGFGKTDPQPKILKKEEAK